MEITWQIWQKCLVGVSITGSAAIVCILFIYCFIKFKSFKNSNKELEEVVVVIPDKNEVTTDKDQNNNLDNKVDENSFSAAENSCSENNVGAPKTNSSLTSSSFTGIGKTFHKDWYHSCPDFGRSTITYSENG